jgi:hypothetical protein
MGKEEESNAGRRFAPNPRHAHHEGAERQDRDTSGGRPQENHLKRKGKEYPLAGQDGIFVAPILSHFYEEDGSMLPRMCPKCGRSLVGARIEHQGKTTWAEMNENLMRSGMLTGRIPPPPGKDLFYALTIVCPGCKRRLADLLVADSSDPHECGEFRLKVARYASHSALTAEMLTAEGSDIRIARPD